jgi:hypothetical protein
MSNWLSSHSTPYQIAYAKDAEYGTIARWELGQAYGGCFNLSGQALLGQPAR